MRGEQPHPVPSGVLEINVKRIGHSGPNAEQKDTSRKPQGLYDQLMRRLLHRRNARSACGKRHHTRCLDIELHFVEALAPTLRVTQ